jgi:hypothetical protein
MLISKSALEGCQDWHFKFDISDVLQKLRNNQPCDGVWCLLSLFRMLQRYDRRPEKQYLYLKVNHVLTAKASWRAGPVGEPLFEHFRSLHHQLCHKRSIFYSI